MGFGCDLSLLVILLQVAGFSFQQYKYQSAFNPSNPFIYPVPPIVSIIVNHPTLNKTHILANDPYNSTSKVHNIGGYLYQRANRCGIHFMNPFDGFILSEEMFQQARPQRCSWGFVGSRYCTPAIQCTKFVVRTRNSDCRMNYLQITDSGESFIHHYCDSKQRPDPKRKFTPVNGVLDVTYRYQTIAKRPEFECYVRCIHYQPNFTTSTGPNNETVVSVLPLSNGIVEDTTPKPRVFPKCKCGISNNVTQSLVKPTKTPIKAPTSKNFTQRINRIVGGRETSIGQYPWMAALVHTKKVLPFCGASLINDRYVLTAAHCLDGEEVDDFIVILNEHDFLSQNETVGRTITRRAIELINHPYYLESTFYGDLALVQLDRPVDISKFTTTPICMPQDMNQSYIDYDVIGSGWGTLHENGRKSPKLFEVLLKVFSNAACNDYHSSSKSEPMQVTDNMLCAGYPEGGRDTCSGDSGGPLITYEGNRFTQVGVTSWGFGCGNPKNPGIFSRVTSFLYWIRLHTVDAIWCEG